MDQQLTDDGRDGREQREGEDPRVQPAVIDIVRIVLPYPLIYGTSIRSVGILSGPSLWKVSSSGVC